MGSNSNYKIAYKALGAGSYNYTFSVDNNLFTDVEGSEILGGDCTVEVELQRSESMLELNVSIDGSVEVACDRCLEPCAIEIGYDGLLIVKFSSESDEYDGDVMWLSPAESELDLRQYIYESIVLSLPYQRVHAEGECNADMIAKLSKMTATSDNQAEEEDNIGLASGEMAKLQALKAKMMVED